MVRFGGKFLLLFNIQACDVVSLNDDQAHEVQPGFF